MKTTKAMNHGGKLLPAYQQTWADYYIKFIEAYDERSINIWGITVQNEPAAKQTWDSCLYTAAEERDFVKNFLGPTVKNSAYPETKIIIWDHNRDLVVERATTVLEDPQAAQYIWGTGIHWYVSEAFENVGEVHKRFPDKHLLFTEGTQEGGVHLGSWTTGERYAQNMIGDLNHWVRGYIDWNLVLNEEGGPNHVGNYCDAPIIADTKNDRIHYNSSYYYIGHFSKFIQPGAQRINVQMDSSELKVTAFKNPKGQLVIIILNEEEQPIDFQLSLSNKTVVMHSPKRSIQTILID
jgi:glucosylceramidase